MTRLQTAQRAWCEGGFDRGQGNRESQRDGGKAAHLFVKVCGEKVRGCGGCVVGVFFCNDRMFSFLFSLFPDRDVRCGKNDGQSGVRLYTYIVPDLFFYHFQPDRSGWKPDNS